MSAGGLTSVPSGALRRPGPGRRTLGTKALDGQDPHTVPALATRE